MAPIWSADQGLHVLRGARLWYRGAFHHRDVFVEKGAVAGILEPGTAVSQRAESHDLSGRFLVAGLSDNHGHLYGLGDSLDMPPLRSLPSWAAVLDAAEQEARRLGPGIPLKIYGWDDTGFEKPGLPEPSTLLDAFPDRSVFLIRVDGHCALVNRVALEETGLAACEEFPPDHLLRDGAGKPTGLLMESAVEHVRRHWPLPDKKHLRHKLMVACNHLAAAGHVAFGDMGTPSWVLEELTAMDRENLLPLRVYGSLDGEAEDWRESLQAWRERRWRGRRFHLLGFKIYADGALGSHGAELLEDYSDRPGHRGIAFHDTAWLQERARAALEHGLQVQIHAIGDGACRRSLDALEPLAEARKVFEKESRGEAVWARLEHTQVLAGEDLQRMARLGVAACVQPSHYLTDAAWVAKRLGPGRLDRAYRWASLVKAGVLAGGGADTPIEPADPGLGLRALVSRRPLKGEAFGAQECLSPAAAMNLYTVNNGRILGWKGLGELGLGAPAAFGVLDKDPFADGI